MLYRVVIERFENNGAKRQVIFDGQISGEGIGHVGRISDAIRGGFTAAEGGKVVVSQIVYVSGDHKSTLQT